jgi:hypothetical protein
MREHLLSSSLGGFFVSSPIGVAKFEAGPLPGFRLPDFRLPDSRFDQLQSLLFDVSVDLAAKAFPIHGRTAFIAREIPSNICWKLDTSRSSCLRPTAVIR